MAAAVQESGSAAMMPVDARKAAAVDDKNLDRDETPVDFMERDNAVVSWSVVAKTRTVAVKRNNLLLEQGDGRTMIGLSVCNAVVVGADGWMDGWMDCG